MSALAQLSPAILSQLITQLSPEQLQALGLRRPATDQETAAYDQAHQAPGAPADFGGSVFPNPNGIKVSDDTESGVEPMRLPNGISLQGSNWHGQTPPLDMSNPPQAEMSGGPHLETTGAHFGSGSAVPIFDPDGNIGDIPPERLAEAVRSGAKPGVHIIAPDGSKGVVPADRYVDAVRAGAKVAPFEEQPIKHPGFWSALGEDLKGMAQGAAQFAGAGIQAAGGNPLPMAKIAGDTGNQVQANAANRKEQGRSAAYRTIAPVGDLLGVNTRGMEEAADEGDVAGVAGHAAAVPAVMAASEGLARGAPMAGRGIAAGAEATRPVAGAVLRTAAEAVNPDVTGIISPRAAHAQRLMGRIADALERRPAEVAPPAQLPEGFQSRAAYQSPAGSADNPTIGPERVAPAEVEPSAKAPTVADIEKGVNNALGGKPLQKGIPLRQQMSAAPQAAKLPTDFTPVESSALRGYKYDPQAQEFSAITKNGQKYTHGEVTPDQAAEFEASDSKGQAWNKIRENNVLVRQNDLPVKPSTMQAPSGQIVPKAQAGNLAEITNQPPAKAMETPTGDLTDILQKSLEKVQAEKGKLSEGTPRFVYRARDIGEEGVPLQPNSHAQATSDIGQALKYAEPGQRGAEAGQVVRIDLSKLKPSDYVVQAHPNGMKWVKFTRPLSETEVSHFAGQAAGKVEK